MLINEAKNERIRITVSVSNYNLESKIGTVQHTLRPSNKTQKITSPEVSSKLFFIIIPLNLGCRYFDSALTKAKAIAMIMTRNLNSNIVTNWVHDQLAVG